MEVITMTEAMRRGIPDLEGRCPVCRGPADPGGGCAACGSALGADRASLARAVLRGRPPRSDEEISSAAFALWTRRAAALKRGHRGWARLPGGGWEPDDCLLCGGPLRRGNVESCRACERAWGGRLAVNVCNAVMWRRGYAQGTSEWLD